jgi:hypothetical protein
MDSLWSVADEHQPGTIISSGHGGERLREARSTMPWTKATHEADHKLVLTYSLPLAHSSPVAGSKSIRVDAIGINHYTFILDALCQKTST